MNQIEIKTHDGVLDGYEWKTPHAKGAVMFIFDGGGLRPAMNDMCQRIADAGYYVLMPNLFHRAGKFAPFDMMTVFSDDKERDRLRAILSGVTPELGVKDMGAALDFMVASSGKAKIGAVGYCFGGLMTTRAASAFPDRIAAGASIHGGNLVTDKPDSPHLGASRIKARMYFGCADNDRSCTPEHRIVLDEALTKAGVAHEIELYAGKAHGFACSDTPAYDKDACERHWQRVFALFESTLS